VPETAHIGGVEASAVVEAEVPVTVGAVCARGTRPAEDHGNDAIE
jgi:hypothetical protein